MNTEKNKPYHHGNLRQELIEKGLEYINRCGVENLSMRKLAEEIGVSPAAPYAHFKNKEAFLESTREYITDSLTDALQETLEKCTHQERILVELGKRYVFFFHENPFYFHFLFTTVNNDLSTNKAFGLFESVSSQILSENDAGYSGKEIRNKTIAMWALVQGIVQISLVDGVFNKKRMDKEIEEIICSLEV